MNTENKSFDVRTTNKMGDMSSTMIHNWNGGCTGVTREFAWKRVQIEKADKDTVSIVVYKGSLEVWRTARLSNGAWTR